MAAQLKGNPAHDFEAVGKGFTWVCRDAVGEGATNHVGDFIAQLNGQLLGDAVSPDDGDVRIRCHQGESVEFILVEFSVFDFDDVLGSLFL